MQSVITTLLLVLILMPYRCNNKKCPVSGRMCRKSPASPMDATLKITENIIEIIK